jgi:hypothetical protein
MINFCCVFYGDKYDVKYVQVLYNMLKRHLTIPYKFICFTDHVKLHKLIDGDIECRRFHHNNYEGWWNKLQLFSPEARLEGVNFYLDLDVVILENIDKFISFSKDDEFSVTRDFSYPTKGFNSSVMKWNNAVEIERIWNPFLKDKTKLMQKQGDQNVISELTTDVVEDMPNLKVKPKSQVKPYPDDWTFSYKWHDRTDPRFDRGRWDFAKGEGSIAVFHGKPNPHESDQDWVKNNWK